MLEHTHIKELNMNVLIAEDDVNIREGLVSLLEKEGYDVTPACDGHQALTAYENHMPDFIILDIMMPKVSGYDVCKNIRQKDTTTPILFLSAKSEEIDRVVGLEIGGDDFVSKPFGSKELMARVRAISRRSIAQNNSNTSVESFIMSDLTVFPAELRAKRGEYAIDLGPRDIKILQLLMEYRGKAVDRRLLFHRCWGEDYIGTTRTLDQHISQLRKKVEIDPKNPTLIQTIHGVGYRFDE